MSNNPQQQQQQHLPPLPQPQLHHPPQQQQPPKSSLQPPPPIPSYESTLPTATTKIPSYPIMTVQHGNTFYNSNPNIINNSPLPDDINRVRSAPVNTPLYPRISTITPTHDLKPPTMTSREYNNSKQVHLRRVRRSRGALSADKQFTSYIDEFQRDLYYNDVDNARGYTDGQSLLNRALITPSNVTKLKKLIDRELELFDPVTGKRNELNHSLNCSQIETKQKLENNKVSPVQIFMQRGDTNWTQTGIQTKINRYESSGISNATALPQITHTGPIHHHPGMNAYYNNDLFNEVNDKEKKYSVNNLKKKTSQEIFLNSSFAKALQDTYMSTRHWERISNANPYLGNGSNGSLYNQQKSIQIVEQENNFSSSSSSSQNNFFSNSSSSAQNNFQNLQNIKKQFSLKRNGSGNETLMSDNDSTTNNNSIGYDGGLFDTFYGENLNENDENFDDENFFQQQNSQNQVVFHENNGSFSDTPRQSLKEIIIAISKVIYDDLYHTHLLSSSSSSSSSSRSKKNHRFENDSQQLAVDDPQDHPQTENNKGDQHSSDLSGSVGTNGSASPTSSSPSHTPTPSIKKKQKNLIFSSQLDAIDSDNDSPRYKSYDVEVYVKNTSGDIIPMKKKDLTGKATSSLFYLKSLFVPPSDILTPQRSRRPKRNQLDDIDTNIKRRRSKVVKGNDGKIIRKLNQNKNKKINSKKMEDGIKKNLSKKNNQKIKKLSLKKNLNFQRKKNNNNDIDLIGLGPDKFPLPTLDEICVIVTNLLVSQKNGQNGSNYGQNGRNDHIFNNKIIPDVQIGAILKDFVLSQRDAKMEMDNDEKNDQNDEKNGQNDEQNGQNAATQPVKATRGRKSTKTTAKLDEQVEETSHTPTPANMGQEESINSQNWDKKI